MNGKAYSPLQEETVSLAPPRRGGFRRLRRGVGVLVRFLLINLLLFVLTSPLVVLYGPFHNLRSSVVGAIIGSRHPQYLTWLLSEKEIKAILGDTSRSPGMRQLPFQISYRKDDTLKLMKVQGTRFHGFLLEIPDPTRVKLATASDLQEIGDTVSTIALRNNAVAAINAGGFYDPQGTGIGRLPYGVVIHNGVFLAGDNIKGAVDLVGLTSKGMLVAGKYTLQEMRKLDITEGVTFGPPLILNGKKMVKGDGGWGIAPRTAIGQRKDGTILFVVIDGRQPGYSLGGTLLDLQNILYREGAYVAANLDGGSSTTMFYNGRVINNPCDQTGERRVPTAFIVK